MRLCIFQKELYHYEWKQSGPIGLIGQFLRDIRYCCQRITKGYCDRDVWNLFSWMLGVIPSAFGELKENHTGHPAELSDGKDGDQRWEQVLNEMIRLFREADEFTCSRENPYEKEWEKELMNKGFNSILSELDRQYLEADQQITMYRIECKDKAFALLSTWFFDLWD